MDFCEGFYRLQQGLEFLLYLKVLKSIIDNSFLTQSNLFTCSINVAMHWIDNLEVDYLWCTVIFFP